MFSKNYIQTPVAGSSTSEASSRTKGERGFKVNAAVLVAACLVLAVLAIMTTSVVGAASPPPPETAESNQEEENTPTSLTAGQTDPEPASLIQARRTLEPKQVDKLRDGAQVIRSSDTASIRLGRRPAPQRSGRVYSSLPVERESVTVTGGQSFSRSALVLAYPALLLSKGSLWGSVFSCYYPTQYPQGFSPLAGMTWQASSNVDSYGYGPVMGDMTSITVLEVEAVLQILQLEFTTPQVSQTTNVFFQCELADTGVYGAPSLGPSFFQFEVTVLGTGGSGASNPNNGQNSNNNGPSTPAIAAPSGLVWQEPHASVDGGLSITMQTQWQVASGSNGATVAVTVSSPVVTPNQIHFNIGEGTHSINHSFTTDVVSSLTPVTITMTATNNAGGASSSISRTVDVLPRPQMGISGDLATGQNGSTQDLIEFGTVPAGDTGTKSITVTNTGPAGSKLFVSILGGGSPAFRVAQAAGPPANHCARTSLLIEAGQHCTLTIAFAPVSGGSFSGNIYLNTNAAQGAFRTIALTGDTGARMLVQRGLYGQTLNDGDTIEFDAVDFPGGQLTTESFVIVNDGSQSNAELHVELIVPKSPFSIINLPSSLVRTGTSYTVSLVSGGHRSLVIEFDPGIGSGEYSIPITLSSNSSNTSEMELVLHGVITGPPQASFEVQEPEAFGSPVLAQGPILQGWQTGPAIAPVFVAAGGVHTVDLGQTKIGSSSRAYIKVGNGSDEFLRDLTVEYNLTGSVGDLIVTPGVSPAFPIDIQYGQSERIVVTYRPTVQGAINATLTITTNDPNAPVTTFHLQGEAVRYRVPEVLNLSSFTDPVARNRAINASYHVMDVFMREYFDDAHFATWATYAKHASRQAGQNMYNMQVGLVLLTEIAIALDTNRPQSELPVWAQGRSGTDRVYEALFRFAGLLSQSGILRQGVQFALAEAGIPEPSILVALNAATSAGRAQLTAQLLLAMPDIIKAVDKVYVKFAEGNVEIYENIAPVYAQFLTEANNTTHGIPGTLAVNGDNAGFLAAAFEFYSQAKELGIQAESQSPDDAVTSRYQQRLMAHWANVYIGFHEQYYLLQGHFDEIFDQIMAMNGAMYLEDRCGTHLMANDWAYLYNRMGIHGPTAPADPSLATPSNFPRLMSQSDPLYQGTILWYFTRYISAPCIFEAPLTVGPSFSIIGLTPLSPTQLQVVPQ